jgi:ureidoacrylate peracid hydrolase
METVTYNKEITAVLVIDPYNDFTSEGGELWDRLKTVAEANDCVPHMLQVLSAARKTEPRVFYALHHRYRQGDYETWKYIAPVQNYASAIVTTVEIVDSISSFSTVGISVGH